MLRAQHPSGNSLRVGKELILNQPKIPQVAATPLSTQPAMSRQDGGWDNSCKDLQGGKVQLQKVVDCPAAACSNCVCQVMRQEAQLDCICSPLHVVAAVREVVGEQNSYQHSPPSQALLARAPWDGGGLVGHNWQAP